MAQSASFFILLRRNTFGVREVIVFFLSIVRFSIRAEDCPLSPKFPSLHISCVNLAI
jgi:hypothetical protein